GDALVGDLTAGDAVAGIPPARARQRVGDGLGVLVTGADVDPVVEPRAAGVDEVLVAERPGVQEVGQVGERNVGERAAAEVVVPGTVGGRAAGAHAGSPETLRAGPRLGGHDDLRIGVDGETLAG